MNRSAFRRSTHARNIGSILGRMVYRVQVHGAFHVPSAGGALLLSSGLGSTGLLLVKSLLNRPAQALVESSIPDLGGDIPIQVPLAIDAQLVAANILSNGGVVLCDRDIVDSGFLIRQSQVPVVPVSVFVDTGHGRVHPWVRQPPALRTRVNVYFGQARLVSDIELPDASQGGEVRVVRYVSEWSRQVVADHQEMVLQRMGGKAAQ